MVKVRVHNHLKKINHNNNLIIKITRTKRIRNNDKKIIFHKKLEINLKLIWPNLLNQKNTLNKFNKNMIMTDIIHKIVNVIV
jgi:hypothetical protein